MIHPGNICSRVFRRLTWKSRSKRPISISFHTKREEKKGAWFYSFYYNLRRSYEVLSDFFEGEDEPPREHLRSIDERSMNISFEKAIFCGGLSG